MLWPENKKKHEDKEPEPIMSRFFRACLLALTGVFLIWLTLQLLSQVWGWLLLIAGVVALGWAVVWLVRWRRDRRW